jgi:flagellar hook-associated protein 3 FlgL
MSTVQIFNQGVNNLLDRQADVTKTQEQLASGKRIMDASEDPAGTARTLDITSQLARIDAYQRNTDHGAKQFGLEEGALSGVINDLQRARELTIQGNNATMTAADRALDRGGAVCDFGVTHRSGKHSGRLGRIYFWGVSVGCQPFSKTTGGAAYNGDDGQRFMQVSADVQIASNNPGSEVFMSATAGNGSFDYRGAANNTGTAVVTTTAAAANYVPETYTLAFIKANANDPITYTVTGDTTGQVATGNYTENGAITFANGEIRFEGIPVHGDSFTMTSVPRQDIFTTIKDIESIFASASDTTASATRVHNEASRALNNLDNALEKVLTVQSDVGTRLRRTEMQTDTNEAFNYQLKETLSELQDLDYAEAISRLNIQMLALQAAQQTFAKTQTMSHLFNYLYST